MTEKECVTRAVEFGCPSRVPIHLVNKDVDQSDIATVGFGAPRGWDQPQGVTEWGFRWVRLDDTMGQPKDIPVVEWSDRILR